GGVRTEIAKGGAAASKPARSATTEAAIPRAAPGNRHMASTKSNGHGHDGFVGWAFKRPAKTMLGEQCGCVSEVESSALRQDCSGGQEKIRFNGAGAEWRRRL